LLPFLLLDFDGPVCSVFAGRPAADVAASLKALAGIETETDDPLRILVEMAFRSDPILTRRVADALRDAEVAAVTSAAPTDGAELAIRGAGTVVIVSNNSGAAVEAYLRAHDLLPFVAGISARDDDLDPGPPHRRGEARGGGHGRRIGHRRRGGAGGRGSGDRIRHQAREAGQPARG
jgi:phosphoglycolate phosphatase